MADEIVDVELDDLAFKIILFSALFRVNIAYGIFSGSASATSAEAAQSDGHSLCRIAGTSSSTLWARRSSQLRPEVLYSYTVFDVGI